MTRPTNLSRRDGALEALRGLASVTVLIWHSTLAFFPFRSGIYAVPDFSTTFMSRFWFGLMFGTSAVSFFFVLSGFVLTRAFLVSGDASIILRNVVKRWPRLAMPVLVTVLASYLVFRLNLYRHQPAAVISQSWWLFYFGNASTQAIQPKFFEALRQGAYLTFLRGDALYDSSLWTMRFEFIGSFVAMGLALLLTQAPTRALKAYCIAVLVAVCHYLEPQYVTFVAGVALAAFLPQTRRMRSRALALFAVGVAVYALGYAGNPLGAFRPLGWAARAAIPPTYVHVFGSVVLIIVAETSPWLHSALSRPWAAFLGRLSFPLYLVHVPVICSIGSFAFISAATRLVAPRAQLMAMAVSMVASFVVAYPLTVSNERWVSFLNRWVAKFLPKTDARGERAARNAVAGPSVDLDFGQMEVGRAPMGQPDESR